MQVYAAIGTRTLSETQTRLCRKIGTYLASNGWILSTGAAVGADQAFASAALVAGGKVLLQLPWNNYAFDWVDLVSKWYTDNVVLQVLEDYTRHADAVKSVSELHPAAGRLSRGALLLHARNYMIIHPDGFASVKFVVALPSIRGGGTMQGVRVAEAASIPVVRLDALKEAIAKQRIEKLTSRE